ncbi:2-oxoacid:ferredoxin oxidoreductase subunit beta [Candidatus Beckwithbacteria bacterium]|nr:2-oxoacid:ferredoxin oxidoreductase subunit beta [Candidatus Beckwithbacteria bacterium]
MMKAEEYNTKIKPNFCPGCGDFGIWLALKNVASQLGLDSSNTALIAGIGCHGHILNFTKINSIEGLHGRPVPVATGIKLVNPRLNVIAFSGDGDCLGEGGNHFIHSCRRNHDINLFIHDNAIYGLTTGQTSPRTPHGMVTKSTPEGNKDVPLNPAAMAITAGATFVARTFCLEPKHMEEIFTKAIKHKGMSVVQILQTCITFNKEYTLDFYRENVYKLPDDYDPSDKVKALKKAMEWGEKNIPLGVLYEEKGKPSYEDQLIDISKKPIVDTEPVVKDVTELFKAHV